MLKGSLQEKNGIYQAVFYYNGKQKWKSTGIKVQRGNKRKAQQRLKEILLEYESNPHMYDKISFVDYSRKWLEKEEGAIDIITFESYKQHVEKHIIPYFEPLDLRLQQVTFEHIEKYYSYKLHNGRLDGKKGGLSRDWCYVKITDTLNLYFLGKSAKCTKWSHLFHGLLDNEPLMA